MVGTWGQEAETAPPITDRQRGRDHSVPGPMVTGAGGLDAAPPPTVLPQAEGQQLPPKRSLTPLAELRG